MHPLILKETIRVCKQRIAEGDNPSTSPAAVEHLESAVEQLDSDLQEIASLFRKHFSNTDSLTSRQMSILGNKEVEMTQEKSAADALSKFDEMCELFADSDCSREWDADDSRLIRKALTAPPEIVGLQASLDDLESNVCQRGAISDYSDNSLDIVMQAARAYIELSKRGR